MVIRAANHGRRTLFSALLLSRGATAGTGSNAVACRCSTEFRRCWTRTLCCYRASRCGTRASCKSKRRGHLLLHRTRRSAKDKFRAALTEEYIHSDVAVAATRADSRTLRHCSDFLFYWFTFQCVGTQLRQLQYITTKTFVLEPVSSPKEWLVGLSS